MDPTRGLSVPGGARGSREACVSEANLPSPRPQLTPVNRGQGRHWAGPALSPLQMEAQRYFARVPKPAGPEEQDRGYGRDRKTPPASGLLPCILLREAY